MADFDVIIIGSAGREVTVTAIRTSQLGMRSQ